MLSNSTGTDTRRQMPLDEDDMLQYAIEQSLAETTGAACGVHLENSSDKVDIWEALRGQGVGAEDEEDEQLQRYLVKHYKQVHTIHF